MVVTVVVVAEVLEEAAEAVTVEVVVAVLGEAAAVVEALEAVMVAAAVVSDPAGTRFSPTTRSTSPAFPPTSQKMISHR